MKTSLTEIIEGLPVSFVEKVKQTDNVPELLKMRKNTNCKDRITLIDARISNINYLVS